MEALQLPQELYWGTKTEPLSPASDEILFPSISLFSPKLESEDDAEDVEVDAATDEMIANAIMDGDILLQLEICEDESGEWNCIPSANYSSQILLFPSSNLKENTSDVKRYSESNDIFQLSPQTLEPPNFNFAINPNQYAEQQLEQHQQIQQHQKIDYEGFLCDLNSTNVQKTKQACLGSPTSSAYGDSLGSERGDEIVDELLRLHSKNLPDFPEDNDSLYSSSSFCSGSDDSSLYKNNSVNSMSPVSTTSDEFSSIETPLQKNENSSGNLNGEKTVKKRSRLYVRNVEEKKSRKKEQNKNAATRYRQKKKVEMKLDLDEERVVLDKNNVLKKSKEEYQREIKYLKKLIREFYKK